MPWLYMGHWFCDKHDASKPWLLEFKSKSAPMQNEETTV